jgi:two-component system sensor histidine kinase HydH
MMGMHAADVRRQRLLSETALQPDIESLMITDADGKVLAHNEPGLINSVYGGELNLKEISRSQDPNWRVVVRPDGKKIFEVYRRFAPAAGAMKGMRSCHMIFGRPFRAEPASRKASSYPRRSYLSAWT